MPESVRFCADEHIPGAVVRGIDVLTAPDAGLPGASDERHMREAAAQGRVIITQDRDFLRLHAAGVPHPGIADVTRTAVLMRFYEKRRRTLIDRPGS